MATYVHQLKDWPHFRWRAAELAQALAEVRHLQGRLVGRMEALNPQLRAEASLATLTAEVVKSSEIEGEKLDPAQVRSSIARRLKVDIGRGVQSERHVDGVVEMILDATLNYGEPLTKDRLFGWHAALFPTGRSSMRKITVGAWRPPEADPMQVVSQKGPIERVHFEAPSGARIEPEMAAFLDWFNRADAKLDPVLKAGIAHFWFVTIHPFEDGNGRIGRAIADMALARSERSAQRFYSISAQIWRERDAYYDHLEETQKGDLDLTAHLQWFIGCFGRALHNAETLLAGALDKARFWERHAATPLNERQRAMLKRLLDGFDGKLTTSKWAKLTKSSPDTALRDIEGLIKRGILAKESAGGRSTSYSLVEPAG
ncbi:MAG: Fic family protein [Alphaproteobacteria bacterium]|nr:Fic family protein [Alphaproteobacteria bacterium]